MNMELYFLNSCTVNCNAQNSALNGCMHSSIGFWSHLISIFLREILLTHTCLLYSTNEPQAIIYKHREMVDIANGGL